MQGKEVRRTWGPNGGRNKTLERERESAPSSSSLIPRKSWASMQVALVRGIIWLRINYEVQRGERRGRGKGGGEEEPPEQPTHLGRFWRERNLFRVGRFALCFPLNRVPRKCYSQVAKMYYQMSFLGQLKISISTTCAEPFWRTLYFHKRIIAYRCRLSCRRVDCESNVCSDFRSSGESAKSRSLLTGMRGKLPDRPDLLFGLLKVSGDFGSLPPRS